MATVFTHHDIAILVGVSIKTLLKHYDVELKAGKAKANFNVSKTLYQRATANDKSALGAAIFWAKAQMGWREVQVIENKQLPGAVAKAAVEITGDKAMQTYLAMLSKK